MAMTVLNNSATMMTLGELNKNITSVGKSLSKVATGQKLNSAKDDASSFNISEQMRAKIRALEQDVQNVQNGSSMLKTALGGIQSIVDELRELKQLAIDAANDSNTDDDRAVMQKVLKQKQANIEYIATGTTFNTKSLLDGTYTEPHWREVYQIEYIDAGSFGGMGIDTENAIHRSMVLRKTNYTTVDALKNKNVNINVIEKLNSVKELTSAFEAAHNGVTFADGTRAVETRDTALYAQRPENINRPDTPTTPEEDDAFEKITYGSVVPNRNFIRSSGGAPLAVKLDFSAARDSDGELIFKPDGSNDISQLEGQGFTILSSDSSHFVNIKFVSGSGAEWVPINDFDGVEASGDIQYEVGIDGFEGRNGLDFARYIFDAIQECPQRTLYLDNEEGQYDYFKRRLGSGLNQIKDNAHNFALSQQFNLHMAKDTDGNVYLIKLEPYSYTLGILDEGFLQEKYTQVGASFYKVSERYDHREYVGDPLWIQHGSSAGQHMNVYINSMQNAALGTDGIDVSTRDRALASIDYIDVALEYALDQATSVGAYLERMDYTASNVNTESENIQAAESTLRDADMAREMTEYAKNNVIFQASQSMLAQSNQMMSGVLGLLQ